MIRVSILYFVHSLFRNDKRQSNLGNSLLHQPLLFLNSNLSIPTSKTGHPPSPSGLRRICACGAKQKQKRKIHPGIQQWLSQERVRTGVHITSSISAYPRIAPPISYFQRPTVEVRARARHILNFNRAYSSRSFFCPARGGTKKSSVAPSESRGEG